MRYSLHQDQICQKTIIKSLKNIGISLDHSVLLQSSHKQRISMPTTRYTDYFHNLFASGGVFQYGVNQVVRDMLAINVGFDHIERIQANISSKMIKSLRRTYFRDRIVNKKAKHIKSFASELMSAITVLAFVADLVLSPANKLPRQRRLIELMLDITTLLNMGDAAVKFASELDAWLAEHNKLFLELYPQCAKPKIHLVRHTKEAFEQHRVNISCGPGERLHRRSKTIATHAFNKFNATVLKRLVHFQAGALNDDAHFEFIKLVGKRVEHGVIADARVTAHIGNQIVSAGDVCSWKAGDIHCYGHVVGCGFLNGVAHVIAAKLSATGGKEFQVVPGAQCAIQATSIRHVLSALPFGLNKMHVLIPHNAIR